MRDILQSYADKGVPEDLVAAANRSEVANAEFQRNSIPGLANVWSNALAAEGRTSPDEDIEAIKHVTLADVNRVAKQYLVRPELDHGDAEAGADRDSPSPERDSAAPSRSRPLPPSRCSFPHGRRARSRAQGAGGIHQGFRHHAAQWIRLIVKTDRTSPTVSVVGAVKHESDLQTPPGKKASPTFSMACSPTERDARSAGISEGARRHRRQRERGLRLLAECPEGSFLARRGVARRQRASSRVAGGGIRVVKQQTAQFVAGNLRARVTAHRARSIWRCCPPATRYCAKPRRYRRQSHPGRCEAISRRHVPSGPHHHRGHRRRHSGRSAGRHSRNGSANGRHRRKARHHSARRSRSTSPRRPTSPIAEAVQDSVTLAEQLNSTASIRTTIRCNWATMFWAAAFTPRGSTTICAR